MYGVINFSALPVKSLSSSYRSKKTFSFFIQQWMLLTKFLIHWEISLRTVFVSLSVATNPIAKVLFFLISSQTQLGIFLGFFFIIFFIFYFFWDLLLNIVWWCRIYKRCLPYCYWVRGYGICWILRQTYLYSHQQYHCWIYLTGIFPFLFNEHYRFFCVKLLFSGFFSIRCILLLK